MLNTPPVPIAMRNSNPVTTSAAISAGGDDISHAGDIHRLNIFAIPTDDGYPAGEVKNDIHPGEGTLQRRYVQDVAMDSLNGKLLQAMGVPMHEGSNGPSAGEKCLHQTHSQVAGGPGHTGKHTAR